MNTAPTRLVRAAWSSWAGPARHPSTTRCLPPSVASPTQIGDKCDWRKGKHEHAGKWCCTAAACRRALKVISSSKPAAAAAAAPAAAKAAPATAQPALTPTGRQQSAVHFGRWRKMVLGERGPRIFAILRDAVLRDAPSEMPDDLTHEHWYELYHVLIDNVYVMPCCRELKLVEVYEVVGVCLNEDGMAVDVRGLYRGPEGPEVIFESCGGVSVTDYMSAGGTTAELVDFVATLSKLAPIADQVDAAEAAEAAKARGTAAAQAAEAAASSADAAAATAAQLHVATAAQATAAGAAHTAAVGSPSGRKRPAEVSGGTACRSSPRVRSGTTV